MFTKNALSVIASLALAEQALGFNAHRHLHDKRALQVDIVTEWVTVVITEGEPVPTATPTPSPSAPQIAPAEVKPTTTSTSIVVVPTPNPIVAAPPAPSTTLVQSIAPKPSAVAPKPSAVAPKPPVVAPAPSAVAPAMAAAAVHEAAPVAVAVSKSAAAPPAASPSNPPSTGGKRGIAYNDASMASAFFGGVCKECSWAYNWDSSANGFAQSGVNFVPMLWGPIDTHTARWTQNADAAIAKGSTHILSFNEPDNVSQCNLPAGQAAADHVKYLNPYAGKVKIGSPAITNSNIAGEGLDWLKSWVSACNTAGCKYDFCVTHWYSPLDAASTLFDHLESVHKICGGKPVWLTEFAPLGPSDKASSFVTTNIPKLDSISYLERYSYFMASEGVLNSGSGLSALGQAYASS